MRTYRFLASLGLCLVIAATADAQAPVKKVAPAAPKRETQAMLQGEAKMSMTAARALAMKTVPGASIQAGELERENGKLIYSFDMKTNGKSGIDEVNIDALTGTLVSKEHESPAAEAAEARADAKVKKPAKP